MREGLQYCFENNLSNIILETYSLAMVHILNGDWETPWSVTMEVNSINRLRNLISIRVQHSLREGNTLADFFANLVFHFAGTYEFNQYQEVPSEGRRIINLNKSIPQLRIRQTSMTS
ncbi:hypothetical protein R3W88_000575 [Solanum pinnatisectum]|uniref:RNase H type-1 domain-containing protein n=1 Tax=Solanum pinnatisectum TaxID=50273 RepID=A0AAV9MGA9_9SOLN|nr:hypothetical protein R3W88_000575 [Solanum pinnatisectum]